MRPNTSGSHQTTTAIFIYPLGWTVIQKGFTTALGLRNNVKFQRGD